MWTMSKLWLPIIYKILSFLMPLAETEHVNVVLQQWRLWPSCLLNWRLDRKIAIYSSNNPQKHVKEQKNLHLQLCDNWALDIVVDEAMNENKLCS